MVLRMKKNEMNSYSLNNFNNNNVTFENDFQ